MRDNKGIRFFLLVRGLVLRAITHPKMFFIVAKIADS
jgi:hypothetical protein